MAVAAAIGEFVAETAAPDFDSPADADWLKERLVMAVNLLDAGVVESQASTPAAAAAWLALLPKVS